MYKLCPSKTLLAVGAQPLAGGISAKSTNWSDSIISTSDFSSDGSPGAVLRMGFTPMEVSEASDGTTPKGVTCGGAL